MRQEPGNGQLQSPASARRRSPTCAAANGVGTVRSYGPSNTMVRPVPDAAVIRVKGTSKALTMTLDGPGYRIAHHPVKARR